MSKAVLVSATLGLLIAACGGSNAGEKVRPDDPTVTHARGDDGPPAVCHEPTAEGTPLIVDWKPEERDDLEAAMKQGVAVVHYDCKSLKVLQDCHPVGKYAFLGTTKREQLISLENADDAQANLPLHGASIGAGLSRGSAIDVGLIMIGKTTTPVDGVTKANMGSHCEGATHYVQSTTIGAFAMKSATAGDVHVKAAIDVFGASGDSSSNKSMSNKDGDPSACGSADLDAPTPPKDCHAPLRVRLLAIGDGAAAATKDAPKDVTCGQGLIAVKGKCTVAPTADTTRVAAAKPKNCTISDQNPVCEQACNGGDADSCALASMNYNLGLAGATADDKKKVTYEEKGCNLGDINQCQSYATSLRQSDPSKAMMLFAKGCDAGIASSCSDLGSLYQNGPNANAAKALRAQARACKAGFAYGCLKTGEILQKGGNGVAADPKTATEIFEMVCHPNDSLGEACYEAGRGYEASDPAKAKKYLGWACNIKGGYPIACSELKKLK